MSKVHIHIEEASHIYFLGIGGIGMSALARYLNIKGIKISGYDRECTELTKKLESEGMTIHYEDDVNFVPSDIELVVYTPAIPKSLNEWVHLNDSGLEVLKRSEALMHLLFDKKVIAIAGTHGKTSTSGMLTHILHSQGFPVTAFIGGVLKNYSSNFIYGESDWVIIEADEYDRSFLRLFPTIAVIQAIDADHLDIYGDKQSVIDSFRDFTLQIEPGGTLWVKRPLKDFWSDDDWMTAVTVGEVEYMSFGYSDSNNDVNSYNIESSSERTNFKMNIGGGDIISCSSIMSGVHNVYNFSAAAAVSKQLGLTSDQIASGIESFKGIKRRFERVHEDNDLIIIDDYAHHPVEIEAAISAVKGQFIDRKLTVIFQPHLFTRTRDFSEDFGEALDKADEVFLLDVYPARELPIQGVDSGMILSSMSMNEKKWISKNELIKQLNRDELEVLLILGAGDIDKLIPEILNKLK